MALIYHNYRTKSVILRDFFNTLLDQEIIDDSGHTTSLGELIADDKALDLDAWLDARIFLLGFPKRLMEIADKLNNGHNLTPADSRYLYKFRRREQKRLFS